VDIFAVIQTILGGLTQKQILKRTTRVDHDVKVVTEHTFSLASLTKWNATIFYKSG